MKAWAKKLWATLIGLFALLAALTAAFLAGKKQHTPYLKEEQIDEETIRSKAREEIMSLPDDDFDDRFPGVDPVIHTGQSRLRSRVQGLLQPSGSGGLGGTDSPDRRTGDGDDSEGGGPGSGG